jgi:hypothetical protein
MGRDHGRREVTMRKNWILGIGAGMLVLSSLFGAIACDDDEDNGNGGTATEEPTTADEGTPANGDATEAPTAE